VLDLSSVQHDCTYSLVLGYEHGRPKLLLTVVARSRRSHEAMMTDGQGAEGVVRQGVNPPLIDAPQLPNADERSLAEERP
jgi:hypothetical protein